MESRLPMKSWMRRGAAALFAVGITLVLSSVVRAGPTQGGHQPVAPHPPRAGDRGPGDFGAWNGVDTESQSVDPATRNFPSRNAPGNRFFVPTFGYGPWAANEYMLPQCQAAFWSGGDDLFAETPIQCAWMQNSLPLGLAPGFGLYNPFGPQWPSQYSSQSNPFGIPFIIH